MKKFLLAYCILLTACNNKHNEKGVELAMQQYDRLLKKMDADSIAWLYTPDGDLGTMAHGRDSIRKFLSSFKDVKVISQQSVSGSIKINADTAVQKGIYHQVAVVNNKDTMRLAGEYNVIWWWMAPGEWHIKKMTTTPSN